MDLSLWMVVLLVGTGIVAGVINTLAGGGTNLTLPALMVMGLPADVANATNRVGVLMQCISGVSGFWRKGKLPVESAPPILVPTLIGGAFGAALASYLPEQWLKPTLLGSMIAMSLLIVLRPGTVVVEPGTEPRNLNESRKAWWTLVLAGFYGGFVQAGVGFILLAAIAGGLRYDLVRANALKMLCAGVFTLLALGIFIARDQVAWVPGIVLAVGAVIGAQLGVKVAISISPKAMKWILLALTIVASGFALVSG
ncbi:sulfite exporter TauE/SafE family protein [Marinibactrum halimedae]|uniref:Probable membrane transporter protein n=1 Tax=Marinibactrum halimedae TaxID=1444977 RepID=A0AA37WN21_9GAMM|nr:sulfite exporter TauE/SafE family protein [Marinibactrum halimedae]MCD9459302.1 sulfite exporter TauE/SafE family protein [Marinibactrum halimedae]GLS25806.1 UPF0721 transmembrane protein [Marinibactrum halimedae]